MQPASKRWTTAQLRHLKWYVSCVDEPKGALPSAPGIREAGARDNRGLCSTALSELGFGMRWSPRSLGIHGSVGTAMISKASTGYFAMNALGRSGNEWLDECNGCVRCCESMSAAVFAKTDAALHVFIYIVFTIKST